MPEFHRSLLLWIGLALAAPGVALGQSGQQLPPGVHADPHSPAAKEYAIPLQQARQGGTGTVSHSSKSRHTRQSSSGSSTAGSASGSLFGAGIARSGGGSSSAASTPPRRPAHSIRHTRPHHVHSAKTATAVAPQTPPATTATTAASVSKASPSGSDSTLALIGGGVAIVILGALGGVLMRRSKSPRAEPS